MTAEWVLDPLVADLRERRQNQAASFKSTRFDGPDPDTHNRNGVSWADAPVPFWLHRCKPQTHGWSSYFTQVERCACGAIRLNGHGWSERNARRRGR